MNNQDIKKIDSLVNQTTAADSSVNKPKAITLSDINQKRALNTSITKRRLSKSKAKFSLYEVYKETSESLKQAETILLEYVMTKSVGSLIRDENDMVQLNEAGEAFASISLEAKDLLDRAIELYSDVAGEPERIKAEWVKNKVMTNRYSRAGFQVVCEFNDLADTIFALNGICVSMQAILINVMTKMEQTESE